MANNKRTRSRRQRSSYHRFPEVQGKVVSLVEVDHNAQAILIMFEDNTVLGFDIDSSHVVFPELSDRKKETGNHSRSGDLSIAHLPWSSGSKSDPPEGGFLIGEYQNVL